MATKWRHSDIPPSVVNSTSLLSCSAALKTVEWKLRRFLAKCPSNLRRSPQDRCGKPIILLQDNKNLSWSPKYQRYYNHAVFQLSLLSCPASLLWAPLLLNIAVEITQRREFGLWHFGASFLATSWQLHLNWLQHFWFFFILWLQRAVIEDETKKRKLDQSIKSNQNR